MYKCQYSLLYNQPCRFHFCKRPRLIWPVDLDTDFIFTHAPRSGRQKGRYRVRTTDSNHDEPIASNRLATAPKATAPNQIWVGDITYIETQEGWLYVAAILDLYSRKIVGWAMSERLDTELVLKALAMALWQRQPPQDLLCRPRSTTKCCWA